MEDKGSWLINCFRSELKNITRCVAEANKLMEKVEAIKQMIADHDDTLFSERTGKLQSGLTFHCNFNSDTLHSITTGIQKMLLS